MIPRGRTKARNVVIFVLEIVDANLYKLGTKHGIQNKRYTKEPINMNQFQFVMQFIYAEEIPQLNI